MQLIVPHTASNMFRKITQIQVDAAKAALEQPPVEHNVAGGRVFNLDIARLLCVTSTYFNCLISD